MKNTGKWMPWVATGAVLAALAFAVSVWVEFYQTAGPGSGRDAIHGYMDANKGRLVASLVTLGVAALGAVVWIAWRLGSRARGGASHVRAAGP